LSAQGTETLGTKDVEGIKTLDDKKTLSAETLGDIISMTPSTLYLNSRIVDLEQQVQDLEALNQVMKEQSWQKQRVVELRANVKRKKQQVKVWKYRASKCYKCLKKVTKQLRRA
jgi:hypothetical protein